MLAGLQSVDAVCIFDGDKATAFLKHAKPDIYVKGGDYTIESLDQNERSVVESVNAEIVIIKLVAEKSTTALIKKVKTI